jgi:hypothetical protein
MSNVNVRRFLAAAAGLAIVAAVVVGCSETITGTPQADPAQTGQPLSPDTTTTSRAPTGSPGPSTSSTTVPTRTTGPGGIAPAGADTTCRDYTAMSDADKRAVMDVLAKDNPMIKQNPELWVGVADMMCSIAPPTAYVKDVVMGKM